MFAFAHFATLSVPLNCECVSLWMQMIKVAVDMTKKGWVFSFILKLVSFCDSWISVCEAVRGNVCPLFQLHVCLKTCCCDSFWKCKSCQMSQLLTLGTFPIKMATLGQAKDQSSSVPSLWWWPVTGAGRKIKAISDTFSHMLSWSLPSAQGLPESQINSWMMCVLVTSSI